MYAFQINSLFFRHFQKCSALDLKDFRNFDRFEKQDLIDL